ncbi:MAG: amidohydrolase family protein, partial [Planctomycetota bacterium]|nr:amidohydrolase family protein [Planctomycetota bacterium]
MDTKAWRTDAHVHLWAAAEEARLLELAAATGSDRMGIACVIERSIVNANPAAWAAKAEHPGRFYVFGGLDHSQHWSGGRAKGPPLVEQVDLLRAIGCDGIKMLENKPATRKELDVPVDGDYFAAYFARVEQTGFPVLWHVADPEEFWDPALTPKWARAKGWGYDGTFVKKERLYAEVERVLARHPLMRVIFAHFFFLSADLPRAATLLERFPGVHLDLAPGIELLYNLSKNLPATRAFFTKYADRIVYGTDISSHNTLAEGKARAGIVTRWLESDEEYRVPPEADFLLGPPEDGIIKGLKLAPDVVAKICRGNCEGLLGTPRPLDRELARRECERLARAVEILTGKPAAENHAGQAA